MPDAPASGPVGKGPGIIAAISGLLAAATDGISVDEIVSALVEKFPERDARAMRNTVKKQLSNGAKKKTDATRGTIYFK
jgi:hypothetical protein